MCRMPTSPSSAQCCATQLATGSDAANFVKILWKRTFVEEQQNPTFFLVWDKIHLEAISQSDNDHYHDGYVEFLVIMMMMMTTKV